MNTGANAGNGHGSMSRTAFILSLIGGIIILIGGLMSFMMFYYFSSVFGWMWGMMDDFFGMMGGIGYASGLFLGLMIVGLVCGIVVIIGALMLNSQPTERRSWGIIILIFALISFVGMGGFFIGAVLGIAGGALALA